MEQVRSRVVYRNPWMTGEQVELARQELAEETGLSAETMTHLGHLFEAYGFSTQGFDVYLTTGLSEGSPDREASDQDMQHRAFPERGQGGASDVRTTLILYETN